MTAPDQNATEPRGSDGDLDVAATPPGDRRPIKARGAGWAHGLSRKLCGMGVSPNAVSVASVFFALLGGASLVISGQLPPRAKLVAVVLLATTPVWIALRLVCNLIDGMIAVEGGKQTRSGIVSNEFPDRVSDVAFLVGAGYAAGSGAAAMPYAVGLGWLAATLAVTVAYVRAMGASAGVGHDFRGPMAKPHRMAVLGVACIAAAIERAVQSSDPPSHQATAWALIIGLALIALGCLITIVRRLRFIVRSLEASP